MKKLIFVFIAICGLNHAYAQSLTGGSLSSCLIEAEEMTAVLGETIVPTPEKGGYLDAGFIEILLAEAVDAGTDPETPIDPTPGNLRYQPPSILTKRIRKSLPEVEFYLFTLPAYSQ